MYRVTVCYGQPTDPAAFDSHYAQVHAALAREIPGLAAFTAGHCAALGKSDPAYYFVATLDFATEEDYRTALRSSQMAKAGADAASVATGGVTMFTQRLDDHYSPLASGRLSRRLPSSIGKRRLAPQSRHRRALWLAGRSPPGAYPGGGRSWWLRPRNSATRRSSCITVTS
jgi:uncharacterized protein (TIGR02118 family)